MKKIVLLLGVTLLIATLAACSDDPEPVDITLTSENSDATLTHVPNAPVVGDEVTIQAHDVEGYRFLRWVDPESDGIISNNSDYTFIATEDRQFVAVYESIEDATLTLESANEAAELTMNKDTILEGDNVTIEASKVGGYAFSHWENDGNILTNARTYTFTVEEDTQLNAIYEPVEDDAVIVDMVSDTPNASLKVNRSIPIKTDQGIVMEASDVEGYEFAYWLDTTSDEVVSQSPTYRFTATEDIRFEAVYEKTPQSTKTVDFENLSTEYSVSDKSVDLYFYEDGVAYVDIETFLNMISGAIVNHRLDISTDHNSIDMEYTIEGTNDADGVNEETTASLGIDTKTNELTVSHFFFFNGLSSVTDTNFAENLEVIDYVQEGGETVTIDLDAYGFDVKSIDGQTRIQFQLANLFFSGSMYDAYFNGNEIYGVDTYQLMNDASLYETLTESTFNDKSMSTELKRSTDNYLELSFDYFYGLKDVKGVQSYENAFEPYENELLASDKDHYRALTDIALSQDDLHTSNLMNGFYEFDLEPEYSMDDLGSRSEKYYTLLESEETTAYCNDTDYELYDNDTVAKVKVNTFDETTLEEFNQTMTTLDSLGTVNQVVLDLSCNSGGVVGYMIQLLGYMTDDPVPFHQKTVTDTLRTTTTYYVDIQAKDYEWSILTSPLTYSAANAMVSIADDMNLATIIGEKPTGGASSVTTNIVPSGTILMMSSANVMTNNEFQSIEFGIEPEVPLEFDQFSNEAAILNALD
ncbi:MAG: S41 family peptidase [Bacillota bacterium]